MNNEHFNLSDYKVGQRIEEVATGEHGTIIAVDADITIQMDDGEEWSTCACHIRPYFPELEAHGN